MKKIAVSLEQEHVYKIKAIQHIHDIDSRSAAVRWFIDEYDSIQSEYEQLNTEYEELQTEVDRLNNEKQTIIEQREENTELIEYAKDQRTTEQRWRQASLTTRLKWKVTGMPEQKE